MVFRWTGNGRGNGVSRKAYTVAGEQTLVKGLRQGDPDAFAALFDLYRSRIYNYVARIVGDPEDAKDITQDVFIKAFRRMPGNGKDLALKPWLYRVATTTSLDHLRARRRRGDTAPLLHDDLPASGDAYEQLEMNGLVQDALDRLSDRHRLILILKDLHGLRHDEIAQILGVSRGATETLLFRARAAFRRAFLSPAPVETDARRRCPETRRAALAFIAADASPNDRRRVLEHARGCRDCRKVVRRTRDTSFGLALFLPELTTPAGLQWTSIGGAVGAAGAAATVAASAAGALTKIGSALTAKAAVVATVAAVTVAGAGVVVDKELQRGGPSGNKYTARGPTAAQPHASPTARGAARQAPDTLGSGLGRVGQRDERGDEPGRDGKPGRDGNAADNDRDRQGNGIALGAAAPPSTSTSGNGQVAATTPPKPQNGNGTAGSSGGGQNGGSTHVGSSSPGPGGQGNDGQAHAHSHPKPPPKHKTHTR